MYEVHGTTITMTRGDTAIVRVHVKRNGEEYTPVEGDRVRFALKGELNSRRTQYVDPVPLLIKDIPIDTMLLILEPEDTKPLLFKKYSYDIEITFANGIVDTFIPDATLEITPEVD